MRFLYFTDTHITNSTPSGRKDDFLNTQMKKMEEVILLSKKLKVDYVLHGGDFFDKPGATLKLGIEYSKIMREFDRPVFIIAGNHDIYGQNPDSVNTAMLGLLEAVDLVKLIKENDEIILREDGLKVQISGSPYRFDIDRGDRTAYYPKRLDEADYHIHMIHSYLLDKPFLDGIDFTLIEDIMDTSADIVLSGHYHRGFKTKFINNKYFINPGSLIRLTRGAEDLNRMPKVVLIELLPKGKSGNNITVEDIYLKTAKPVLEVFFEKEGKAMEERLAELKSFEALAGKNMEENRYDFNKILEEMWNKEGFPKDILNEALIRIEKAQRDEINES